MSDTEDPYGDVASAVHRAEEEPAPQGIWSGKLGREIAVEQRHLDRVYDRLAELRRQAQAAERDGYRMVDTDRGGLDLGPENPLTTTLVERDVVVHRAARRQRELDAAQEGLVFGRLDRRDGDVLHIGRMGIRDADATSLVMDWRAPAAADYYRATAADPRGLVRRRTIRSEGRTVTGLDDDLLDPSAASDLAVVGDGGLLADLSRARGTEMRDIVATIQREQDEVIRSPGDGVTAVEGGPGTGKTAVALHRAAYLLYADRGRFARGILVVGPTPVFLEYISTVLPSLGEEAATLRTLGDLVDGVTATRADASGPAAVKGSLRMATVLRRAATAEPPGAPTRLRLAWRGGLLRVDASTLAAVRRRALSHGRGHNEVRREAFDGVFDALWEDAGRQVGSYRGDRAEFEAELSDRQDFRDFLRAWWPLLRSTQVLARLADPEALAGWARGVLTPTEVTALASSLPWSRVPLPAMVPAATEPPEGYTTPDVALLDELRALLGTPPRAGAAGSAATPEIDEAVEYAHLVVDEAQDVSPMQWRMLGRRGRRASWTVVGDPAQATSGGDPAERARARDAALPGPRRVHTLSTNYRNPAEIFAVAAPVVRAVDPDAPLPVSVRSAGVAPVHHLVAPARLPARVRAAAAELVELVEGTVGVITPEGRRDEVAGWLETPDRVRVVTCRQAKGMEYDGVVVVEPGRIRDGSGARMLYVSLSRATQRLATVATDRWR